MARAEEIAAGPVPILGYGPVDFGDPIDWHVEPIRGIRVPPAPWFRIPYLDCIEVGDHKVTWEASRHQHLVTLARAWTLGGDPDHPRLIERQLRQWWDRNPYGIGINWASSLEVAFRLISWAWIDHLTQGCTELSPDFRARLRHEMALSAWHVERYLSTYFAPNTHLIGEAYALFVAGQLCSEYRASSRWRSLGWRVLCEELEKQVLPDGFYFEQSTYYHVYALDFFVHARILAERNGCSVPAHYDPALARMGEALAAFSCGAATVRWGDDDGGRVFDSARNRNEHLSDPFPVLAALLGRADFKAAGSGYTEEAVWLLGEEGLQRFQELEAPAEPVTTLCLPDAGAYVQALGARARIVVDAGPHGFGNGGHAHADALALNLLVDGTQVLGDPGTYVYPAQDPGRNEFRGTSAHNTLEVDGLSQAEPGSSFAWTTAPVTTLHTWSPGSRHSLFAGSHDGYRRLADPVEHARWVLASLGGFALVWDRVEGQGKHDVTLSWHAGPEYEVEIGPGGADLTGPGSLACRLIWVEGDDGWTATAEPGWWSQAYGHRSPAAVIRIRAVQASLPRSCVLGIVLEGHGRLARLDADGGSVRCYKLESASTSAWVWFADAPGLWHRGPLESDARVVCLERSNADGASWLTAFGGERLRVAERDVPVLADSKGAPGNRRLVPDPLLAVVE